jgi:hypothetical protein
VREGIGQQLGLAAITLGLQQCFDCLQAFGFVEHGSVLMGQKNDKIILVDGPHLAF